MKILLLIVLNYPLFAFAQNTQKESDHILNMQIGIAGSSSNINLKNELISAGNLLSYESNTPAKIGVSLGYRNIGLGFGTSSEADNQTQKGVSKYQDYSLRLLGKNSFSLGFSDTTGYFVQNTQNPTNGIFEQKTNLNVQKTSFSWLHNFFHDDLSLPAVFSYSGWQTKSGWTVLSFLQLNRGIVQDAGSIITTSQTTNFPTLSQYQKIDRNSASAGIGLAGALVYEGFQLGLLATVGGSIEEKILTDINNNTSRNSAGSTPTSLFVNVGYNGKKHQLGASIFINSYSTKIDHETLDESSNDIRFFYGYRFDGVNLGSAINTASSWLD